MQVKYTAVLLSGIWLVSQARDLTIIFDSLFVIYYIYHKLNCAQRDFIDSRISIQKN